MTRIAIQGGVAQAVLLAALSLYGCDGTNGGGTAGDGGDPPDGGAREAGQRDGGSRNDGDSAPDGAPHVDGAPAPDAGSDGGSPTPDADVPDLPPSTCERPIALVDTSSPDHVVGDGTPESCTGSAFASAASQGGIVTFDCGSEDVAITVDETVQLPTERDTIIDGGGTVTLDGDGSVRILRFHSDNYRTNTHRVVLQRLTLRNGAAQGADYTEPSDSNPACAYGYADGAGGAIRVRDGVLHVLDSRFLDNEAASPGPDVGGGAIYALGSLDVTVVGSTFRGNSGSNGGAVGLLQTTGTFANTVFEDNQATGMGQNVAGGEAEGCPGVGHEDQGGAGGNGGAISIDGADDLAQTFCGVTFEGNDANELGGCVFRTANGEQREATFRRARLVNNHAGAGGGCLYISNSDFTLSRSLVANNSADGLGGGVRTELGSIVDVVNTTFYGNVVHDSLAGALRVNEEGVIRNCTFAENRVEGDESVFTAAVRGGGSIEVYNTVFADNTTMAPYNPQTCTRDPFGGSHNFQWPTMTHGDTREDWPCTSGITWAAPELGPLQDNDGPTRTMLPADGSMVIGAGQSCPDVDQRGRSRPANGCTAGAVEVSGN